VTALSGGPQGTRPLALRRARLALCVLVPLASTTCGPPDATGPDELVFRIGVLAHTSPEMQAVSGVPTLEAAEMAAAELNEEGGILIGDQRVPVRIVAREHTARLENVTSAARSLINLDSVHVLVGPQFSQHAIPVGGIANRSGVPMISPMSSNPATTAGRPYVFRLAFLDADQGEVLAGFARDSLGLGRVGVLVNLTSSYATEVAERFSRRFRELGGEIVEERYPGGEPDVWRRAFRAVLAQRPDRIFLPLQRPELEALMQMIEEESIPVKLLGADSWDVLTMERFPAAQGAYLTHQWMWNVPDHEAAPFVTRYRARYGSPPRSTAALTYDAVRVMARAASSAGSLDGSAIRDALSGLPTYAGVSGPIAFGSSNSPDRDVVISRIEDGTAVFVARLRP